MYKSWFWLGVAVLYSCTSSQPTEPEEVPPVSFSVVSQTDTIVRVKVTWNRAQDQYGAADYYLHTMTASKTVTDSTTGPLPNLKRVNGLADTVNIRISLVADSVTVVSRVWSVRRGLQSTTPAQGQLFIRRADRPPPPPDSIKVDTLVIGFVWGGPGITYTTGPVARKGIDPWVDTINFNRLYRGNPPAALISDGDNVVTGDTTVVSSYRHPNVRFSIRPTGIVELARDSMSSIFRAVGTGAVYIIAEYYKTRTEKIRDSLRVVAVNNPYCAPWPDCYYNPDKYFAIRAELPRVFVDVPSYTPITCPSMIINYKLNNIVDTIYSTDCTP